VFSYETRLGQAAIIPAGLRCVLGRRLALMRPDQSKVDPRFLLYNFLSPQFQEVLRKNTVQGSTVDRIMLRDFPYFPIVIPPLNEQRGIATTLGALDDKIESDRRQINLLPALAEAMYVAAREEGATQVHVGEIAEFHNRRRVPLSSRERDQRPGPYPYYGATGVFGHVDGFIFDEVLALVGEDGSVINDDGTPVTQYIWGKSWINNHAHPLTGRGISTELLLLVLRAADVRPIVTGAVQPKVSMGNLKSLPVEVPRGEALVRLEAKLQPLFDLYREVTEKSRLLVEMRDTLLPELLSGRIRVPEAEEAVAQVGA
jgi:type I restriction enzyme S subunit